MAERGWQGVEHHGPNVALSRQGGVKSKQSNGRVKLKPTVKGTRHWHNGETRQI